MESIRAPRTPGRTIISSRCRAIPIDPRLVAPTIPFREEGTRVRARDCRGLRQLAGLSRKRAAHARHDARRRRAVAPPPSGPYPIVLAHGLFGFTNIGPLDYFYGVAPVLEAQGRTVFATAVDPVQTLRRARRAARRRHRAIPRATGAPKVVIIGHSQGGLDARWAASHDPDAVAAVITIATPHLGSPVADVAMGLAPGDAQAALDALADLVRALRDQLRGRATGFDDGRRRRVQRRDARRTRRDVLVGRRPFEPRRAPTTARPARRSPASGTAASTR